MLFNCSARIEKEADGTPLPQGNSTEKGLIKYLLKKGVDAFNHIKMKEGKILVQIPFNSKRKRACTAIKSPENPSTVNVYLKGAPEIVINYCTKMYGPGGEVVDLSETKK